MLILHAKAKCLENILEELMGVKGAIVDEAQKRRVGCTATATKEEHNQSVLKHGRRDYW